MRKRFKKGFTLIELLVALSIVGILLSFSIFALRESRETARDSLRKADIETIRSGLELYRADCDSYPLSLTSPLVGDNSTQTCLSTNIYIEKIPTDPLSPQRTYSYYSDGKIYELCASLEKETGTVSCVNNCGDTPCNYKVKNP